MWAKLCRIYELWYEKWPDMKNARCSGGIFPQNLRLRRHSIENIENVRLQKGACKELPCAARSHTNAQRTKEGRYLPSGLSRKPETGPRTSAKGASYGVREGGT